MTERLRYGAWTIAKSHEGGRRFATIVMDERNHEVYRSRTSGWTTKARAEARAWIETRI